MHPAAPANTAIAARRRALNRRRTPRSMVALPDFKVVNQITGARPPSRDLVRLADFEAGARRAVDSEVEGLAGERPRQHLLDRSRNDPISARIACLGRSDRGDFPDEEKVL